MTQIACKVIGALMLLAALSRTDGNFICAQSRQDNEAAPSPSARNADAPRGLPLPILPGITPPASPTLGGQVFWADELVYHDWRIQRNTFTGHCRLLDAANLRYAQGTFDACLTRLDEIKRERKLPAMKGKAVLVLHGLIGVRQFSAEMAKYLHDNGGYTTFCLSYPSQFDDIGTHAKSLASVIEHLEGIEEINLVAHSMGNLVIRHYLADTAAAHKEDSRIKRIVMIGPPNNGADLASKFGDHPVVAFAIGASGQQLGKLWPELAPHLATPACEFGIIAGGNGTPQGFLPFKLLDGDNDGVVTVATTRLPGARDFIVVPVHHQFHLSSKDIQRYTLRFLKLGYFIAENDRQPIKAEE